MLYTTLFTNTGNGHRTAPDVSDAGHAERFEDPTIREAGRLSLGDDRLVTRKVQRGLAVLRVSAKRHSQQQCRFLGETGPMRCVVRKEMARQLPQIPLLVYRRKRVRI